MKGAGKMSNAYSILIQLIEKGGYVFSEPSVTEEDAIAYAKKLISKYGSAGDQVYIWRVDSSGAKYYYNAKNEYTKNREPWCLVS